MTAFKLRCFLVALIAVSITADPAALEAEISYANNNETTTRTLQYRRRQNRPKNSRRRPNLLFIMTDQQRFDAFSRAAYQEGERKILYTPHMDKLAEEGVLFGRAYTSSPVCGPARTSLFTGLSIENRSEERRVGKEC